MNIVRLSFKEHFLAFTLGSSSILWNLLIKTYLPDRVIELAFDIVRRVKVMLGS